jgi:hypothetical protein
MRSGLEAHIADFQPGEVVATEPNSYSAREMLKNMPVRREKSDQFLCHPDAYREFMGARKTAKMEDFYRWQRKRLSVLMDGDAPVTGRWNFDEDNRQPPPKTDHDRWPQPDSVLLDALDQQVLADVAPYTWGAAPTGLWATSRSGALARLKKFVTEVLPMFGEHEDAMLKSNWHLAHSLLSPYLNNGLLLPGEVVDAVVAEFEKGKVPINSAEGFLRQLSIFLSLLRLPERSESCALRERQLRLLDLTLLSHQQRRLLETVLFQLTPDLKDQLLKTFALALIRSHRGGPYKSLSALRHCAYVLISNSVELGLRVCEQSRHLKLYLPGDLRASFHRVESKSM